jgi:hypothetical protein
VQAQGGQAIAVQIYPRQNYGGAYFRPNYRVHRGRGRVASNSTSVLRPSTLLPSTPSGGGQLAAATARQQAKMARVKPGTGHSHGKRR